MESLLKKKMNQESKKVKAIDLMLLDLQTRHSDIRIEAKEYQCEDELEEIKRKLLSLLTSERELLQTK